MGHRKQEKREYMCQAFRKIKMRKNPQEIENCKEVNNLNSLNTLLVKTKLLFEKWR